jgi:hypothetical protein
VVGETLVSKRLSTPEEICGFRKGIDTLGRKQQLNKIGYQSFESG